MWSIGVILYECMHLQAPFEADTLASLGRKVLAGVYSLHNHYSSPLNHII